MGDILNRLDELKYLDKASTLPWLSKTLLSKYMETAPDVSLATRVIAARPSLGSDVAKAPAGTK
jgi:hypothetical protein